MLPVTVVHLIAGGAAVELTPMSESVRFDTAAVGGFGSLEASFPGDIRKQFGYLGLTRLYWGSALLWEGQLEDVTLTIGETVTTTIRCFGLKRKLEETSVRRVWSTRSQQFSEIAGGDGQVIEVNTPVAKTRNLVVSTGNFDPSDLTKSGGMVSGSGAVVAANGGNGAWTIAPVGITWQTLYATASLQGANSGGGKMIGRVVHFDSAAADSYNDIVIVGVQDVFISPLHSSCHDVRIEYVNVSGGNLTPTVADYVQLYNIRLLGTSLVEDASGGFYGGTILRDLVALVSGLTAGDIDTGSDYTIQQIERSVRSAAIDVVQEVAGYYTREWAVWEDGRVDWRTRNLDEPQWTIPLSALTGLELEASTDGVARTVYVLYTDAASGYDAEQSAVATDQRNPYLRQGVVKDTIVSPGFPMTSNTASQLATTLLSDLGLRPAVTGRCELPAALVVSNLVGGGKPAAMIRGGDNVLLPDLPKTDPLLQGRDGETLFHIVSSSVDLRAGTVSLEFEGQMSRQSVILARLAASTRTLTG